ncbi:unnamed protein product [Caenorhabditis brenneri]
MVNNVKEREREARNQVGGANLKEIRSVVEGGKRWFKDVVKNVTLELEIPNKITTHPDREEQFAERLVSIAKKYAPARSGRSMRVGMNFSSEELLESVGLSFKKMHTFRATVQKSRNVFSSKECSIKRIDLIFVDVEKLRSWDPAE